MRIIAPAVALALAFGSRASAASSATLPDRPSQAEHAVGSCGSVVAANASAATNIACTCVESPQPALTSNYPHTAAAVGVAVPQPDPGIIGYPVSRNAFDRRDADPVDTVRPEHSSGKANPLGVSAEEWRARTELAAAYRALYVLGLERSSLGSDQSAQCAMHRLDDAGGNGTDPITFLMAEWGVWFEEVTASNLLKFTVDGLLVHPGNDGEPTEPGRPDRTNSGCVPVAKAIFEARPDVRTIIHIHPYAVMAVGGLEWGLLPLSQAAFFLWGQVSREAYDFSYTRSFEDALASGFGNGERAMLLNHHWMYAVGRDAAEALFVATHLTQACEVQVRTLGMVGGDLRKVVLPSGEELSAQYRDMMDSTDYSYDGSREWPGIVRKLQRQAPDYNT